MSLQVHREFPDFLPALHNFCTRTLFTFAVYSPSVNSHTNYHGLVRNSTDLVPLRCAQVARGSDDFLGLSLLRRFFGSERGCGRFLHDFQRVDVSRPDAFLRLSRSAEFGARAQFQYFHKLVNVLFRRKRSQGAVHVLAPHTAFPFARQIVFVSLSNFLNFFKSQRMHAHGCASGSVSTQ